MGVKAISSILTLIIGILAFSAVISAQPRPVSQEITEGEGLPVLLLHLPNWNAVRDQAIFSLDREGLRPALGDHPILSEIEFVPGVEAVSAPYAVGRLLIVEYPTPQHSVEADLRFREFIAANPGQPPIQYQRVGNYSVFVFGATDAELANALISEVRYEKSVQWLGEDPFLLQKLERYFAVTARDVALSTVLWIFMGVCIAVFLGIVCGLLFFRYRENRRLVYTAFSDAGGLTRLNLDGFTEPIRHD
jgi:hypothetical protein